MNISFGSVLGVDIGPETVKIAELRFSFRSFELISYKESSYIASDEGTPLVSETLKTLLPAKKLSRKKVMLSVPGSKVAFRIISFPFTAKKKIDSVINFEVENLLPFDPDEIVIDYAVLGINGTTASVLCAAAEKREIDTFINDLKKAGIDPEAVDVDLFGFFNTVHTNFTGKTSTFMAINIDTVSSSILILNGGKLICVKSVKIGYRHLVIEGSAPERDDSSTKTDGSPSLSINQDKIKELLTDIKRVIGFIKSDSIDKIESVYWCGKSIDGFSEILSKEIAAVVSHWNPMNLKGLKKGGFRLMGDENLAAVALGLSLRDYSRQFSGVNFKKSIYPFKGFFQGLSGNIKTPLVLSGIVLLLITFSLYFKQMVFQNEFAELNLEGRKIFKQALPGVRRVVNEVLQLKEKIEKLDREVKILGTVEGAAGSPISFLREISLHYPSSGAGEIYRYTFGKEDIRIEGMATSLKAVDLIKKEFSGLNGFSRVQVASTKLASDKKSIDFRIIMTFNTSRG